MTKIAIGRWITVTAFFLVPNASAVAQNQPEPALPDPIVPRAAADREQEIQTNMTADIGVGEVGQRLDGMTETVQLPRSPLLRIPNRIENRIRNRIDRNYDPTANATAPFERAERTSAPLSSGPRIP